MPNGELRFRLRKSDGTAYIRTEASEVGGWQKSHYHKSVRETYIVQRGWIALAEAASKGPRVRIFRSGDLFTTQPGVIHNIYMSGKSVIHTVKHGEAIGEDRIEDDATSDFDKSVHQLSENAIMLAASAERGAMASETYTAEYRHFDRLIWQVPAWSTAIFALTAAGAHSIAQSDFLKLETGWEKRQLVGCFL
jgi:hypothetical protein